MISFIATDSIIQVHEGRVLGDRYEHGQKQFYAPMVYSLFGKWDIEQ